MGENGDLKIKWLSQPEIIKSSIYMSSIHMAAKRKSKNTFVINEEEHTSLTNSRNRTLGLWGHVFNMAEQDTAHLGASLPSSHLVTPRRPSHSCALGDHPHNIYPNQVHAESSIVLVQFPHPKLQVQSSLYWIIHFLLKYLSPSLVDSNYCCLILLTFNLIWMHIHINIFK